MHNMQQHLFKYICSQVFIMQNCTKTFVNNDHRMALVGRDIKGHAVPNPNENGRGGVWCATQGT